MKRITLLFLVVLVCFGTLHAQGVAINADGSNPNASSILDVKSTDKGMLIPRMTNAEITLFGTTLGTSDRGMIVFNIDDMKLEYWDGADWKTMVTKTSSPGNSSDGTSYCSEGVTDYDGNKYKTVKIGNQCWMAENLKSNHYADGSAITEAYNYDTEYGNGLTYGYLYTWAAVMNGTGSSSSNPSGVQGVCPDGWHVPSDAEWRELEMTLGMTTAEANSEGYRGSHSEGRKIKETEDAFLWTDHANRGTNSSGFSALPGGCHCYGSFFSLEGNAAFWSSTESPNPQTNAWYRSVISIEEEVFRGTYLKSYSLSVRCLQD